MPVLYATVHGYITRVHLQLLTKAVVAEEQHFSRQPECLRKASMVVVLGRKKRLSILFVVSLHRLLDGFGSPCEGLIKESNLASPAMPAAEELECILSAYSLSVQTLPAAAGASLATP